MKQFQYLSRLTSLVYGPYSFGDAMGCTERDVLEALEVGESKLDRDGDMWTRLPDVESADELLRDERLERIATAAMQSLLVSPHTRQCESAEGIAINAVAVARALILELDKQA